MKLARCPTCKSEINLLAIVEDEATKELMMLMIQTDPELGRWVAHYLSLWSPMKSNINTCKALKVVKDVLALSTSSKRLIQALEATVSALRQPANGNPREPLKHHNYLKKVLSQIPEVPREEHQPTYPANHTEQPSSANWAQDLIRTEEQ